jgi:hypothetical protein
MPPEICTIPDCDEPVKYFHLQVCSACYSGLARWRGRSVAEKRRRLAINHRLVSRMSFVMENPKHHPQKREDIKKAAARKRGMRGMR